MRNFSKKALSLALAVLLILAMAPMTLAADTVSITILSTSDLHGNIWGYSYEDQKDTANNGLARVATYIKEQRALDPDLILVDVGDTIQGTILTDDLYNKNGAVKSADEKHIMMDAMNKLGYEAMALGNHEFNFGSALIERLKRDADFPILSANSRYANGDELVAPYTIVEREGMRFGILGLTTPMIPRWDGEKVDDLTFEHMGEAAARNAKILKEVEKVDFIIAICHAGWLPEYDLEKGSDGAQFVASMAPEIDVLLIGHNHIVYSRNNAGEPVVGAPRNSGRDVVRVELTIDRSGAAPAIVARTVDVVDMVAYSVDQELRDYTAKAHQDTLDFINGGGDAMEGPMKGTAQSGIFGVATTDFQPVNEILGIPEGKLRPTAVMDLINTVQLLYSGADVSAAALFSDTSDIKEGNINYGTIFGIYKYDNTLYRVPITGAELKAYMEWSMSCYNQWVPGDISISFNPDKPGYLYDMFAGVDYEVDLSKPAGQRVTNVMYKGKPLADDQELTLAVNNYRYSSGLKAYDLVAGVREWESPIALRDMLVEYIREQETLTPTVTNNWKIVGVDLENEHRDALIALVNAGKLEVPYAKALNVKDLAPVIALLDNLTYGGVTTTAESVTVGGETYYRLRDIAAAVSGTDAQFNVAWDGKVVVTPGEAYEGDALIITGTASGAAAKMAVTVKGTDVSCDAVLVNGNYFVTTEALGALLK